MTYLVSQLWLYLLCAGLLGLLLGWVIWGWFGRRKITALQAEYEQERLSLTRGFEADRTALEEQKVAAFRTRDEALETKASLIDQLEGERKISADAKAQIGRLTQADLAARTEFKNQLADMQRQLELEQGVASEAKETLDAVRIDMGQQLQDKQSALQKAEQASKEAAETLRVKVGKLESEARLTQDTFRRSLDEERSAKTKLQAELQQERLELSEAKDAVDTVRNDLTQKLQAKQAAMSGAETATNAARREAEEARAEVTRLQMAASNSNEQAIKAEVERVRQSMQRSIEDERKAKDAARTELARLTNSEREAKDQVLRLQSKLAAMLDGGQGSDGNNDQLRRDLEQARQRQRELEIELAKLRAQLNQRETISVKKAASPQKFTTDAPRPASLFDRRPDVVDDLKEVKGIGPVMERILNENGCYHFKQLANFSKRDIEWISQALGSFPDRIERDEWVSQAQSLYYRKYGQRHDVGDVGRVRTLATTS